MKKIIKLILFLVIFSSKWTYAQTQIDTIRVWGNCEHCKERIEGTVSQLNGVTYVLWNNNLGQLTVHYDPSKLTNITIQKAIADVGHDTQDLKANNKVYNKLPSCCKYERKTTNNNANIKSVNFKITGMTCSEGCAKGIEMTLYKQKGVKLSSVDFGTQNARVIYDSSKITKEQLIAIIENFKPEGEKGEGYKVIELK